MNQTCKVCGEPAAGFHFGAFTCEGCKSFFGRSYNNLSSISECKNNGECIINKKNRTACKACRLRKCLLVGMSKSGSRYGRRSNWFKIHCLLQEQQQQQQAAAAQGNHHSNQKPSPTGGNNCLNSLNMFSHLSGFPPGTYGRPSGCTKEEFMLLGLDDYHNSSMKRPSASPSVSSPDSHNSDSSIEIGDRRHNLLRTQSQKLPENNSLNKELFLPLPFPGLSAMHGMPPSGFLPPAHLLFPGYHPGLYQHHQGLLKPSTEPPHMNTAALHQAAAAAAINNNSRLTPNHNNKAIADEMTKRFYLDVVLKSQQRSPGGLIHKTEENETEDAITMTPPRSPATSTNNEHRTTTTPMRTSPPIKSTTTLISHQHNQDTPIDLSIKTGSTSSATSDYRASNSRPQSEISEHMMMDDDEDDEDINVEDNERHHYDTKSYHHRDSDDELDHRESEYEREVKRMKIQRTTPLDLTTKV